MSERVAVVTAGAGAIGGAIVRALAAAGFATEVLDREQCDLADAASVRRAAAGIARADVLVHAAGTVPFLCTDAAAAVTGQTLCVDGGPGVSLEPWVRDEPAVGIARRADLLQARELLVAHEPVGRRAKVERAQQAVGSSALSAVSVVWSSSSASPV